MARRYEGRPLTDAYPPGLRKILSKAQDFAQLEVNIKLNC